MDFDLPEELIAVRDLAREFAEKEIAPTAAKDDKEQTFRGDLLRKMGDRYRQVTSGLAHIQWPARWEPVPPYAQSGQPKRTWLAWHPNGSSLFQHVAP